MARRRALRHSWEEEDESERDNRRRHKRSPPPPPPAAPPALPVGAATMVAGEDAGNVYPLSFLTCVGGLKSGHAQVSWWLVKHWHCNSWSQLPTQLLIIFPNNCPKPTHPTLHSYVSIGFGVTVAVIAIGIISWILTRQVPAGEWHLLACLPACLLLEGWARPLPAARCHGSVACYVMLDNC